MRHPRLKTDYQDTWYHCYNRAVGTSSDRPFDDPEKERFVQILHRLARLYTVEIVAYQVMSNHFHLLLHAPRNEPSEMDTCLRYKEFHGGKQQMEPGDKQCLGWQKRLRDVSWFMRHLEHLFTCWYNRTRPQRRRGPLWSQRFKNTVLESGAAVESCWAYIERNPVRAGMVQDPAGYRFCSFGIWSQSGRHPFAESFRSRLLPVLGQESLDAAQQWLRQELARQAGVEAKRPDAEIDAAMQLAGQPVALSTMAQRRVRYWVDGLVIGSELFVRDVMTRARGKEQADKHRLASTPAIRSTSLCCWRRLRPALC